MISAAVSVSVFSATFLVFVLSPSAFSAPAKLDTANIEKLTGLKGTYNEKEAVFKVSFPRSDLNASSGGVKLTPALGLTAWAAFQKAGAMTMVMGDTVLLEDQVNPVMTVALDNGLEVTALHNHFFGDAPKIMFMHISGMGAEAKLAQAVGHVYDKLKETMGGKGSFPKTNIDPAKSTLKPEPLNDIFGLKGELKDGVYKVTVGRKTTMQGHNMGNAMGVNTWAAFAGSDDEAVVDGDFAMLENELQTVLKKLRAANINVVAIHNHMSMEVPRMIFLHFWGVGKPADLAKGLKTALDTQKL
jgi:hypothetical protein